MYTTCIKSRLEMGPIHKHPIVIIKESTMDSKGKSDKHYSSFYSSRLSTLNY